MIEKLPERGTRAGPSRLLPVDSVKCLIHEGAEHTEVYDPCGHQLGACHVMIHVGQRPNDIDEEPHQGDQVRSHTL